MSTTVVMGVMVDAGPVRWRWAGPVVGMTRRRGVGRWPARLMFAGWDRRSAVRRKVPSLETPQQMAGGIERPGIGPAAAGRRRVMAATITTVPTAVVIASGWAC
jgi:hypothetical protein